MTWRPRVLVAPVAMAAVVVAALATGGQDAPSPAGEESAATTDAPSRRIVSDDEFCTAFERLAAAQEAHLSQASPLTVDELKTSAGEVGDLAPGVAMSQDALAGVDYVVAAFLGLPDDASAQDVVESDDGATLEDDANAQALAAYITESCQRPLSDAR